MVLAEEGCNLVLVSRNAHRLTDLADTIRSRHGVPVSVVAADLASTDEVERVASSVAGTDVLVNNSYTNGTILTIDGGPA